MKRLYSSALILCTFLSASAQEVIWQKDIQSSTQDFLSQITTTIDGQYLITGSTIPSTSSGTAPLKAGGKSQMPNAKCQQQTTINHQPK